MADARRGMTPLLSSFDPQWDSQAWRRLISDAHARLQYGEVTEVTELTTVVQVVTVEQTGGCRGRGDNQECEDRNRCRQPYGKTDEPSLHGTMSGLGSGLTNRRSGSGIELNPVISKAPIVVNQEPALGSGLRYIPQRAGGTCSSTP